MPDLIWKDILHPGTQCDRHGEKFTITPHDCRQAGRNIRKMVGRGLRIPVCWEHQSTANPVFTRSPDDRLADYARNTFGEIRDARTDPAGVLWAAHQVDDPADRRQLAKTKFVSPKLYGSYADSRGGTYLGTTVGHVAVTPTPVQYWQQPFELSALNVFYLSWPHDGGSTTMNNTLKTMTEALGRLGFPDAAKARSVEDLAAYLKKLAEDEGGDGLGAELDDAAMLMSDGRGGRSGSRRVPTGAATNGGDFVRQLRQRMGGR